MTSSIPAPAPLAPVSAETPTWEKFRDLDDERDAGVRAFRGLLIASGLATVLWSAVGVIAWALFQIPR